MRHLLYIAFFFCFVTLTSCGGNSAGDSGIKSNDATSSPVFVPATTPAYTTPLPADNKIVTSTAMPRLNPAHGQPGHRCDVSVGAPLPVGVPQNIKPVTSILPVANSAMPVMPAMPAIQAKTTIAGAGLNPAHGQPGHRCDIAVGAPLSGGTTQNLKSSTPNSPLIASPVQNTPVTIQPQAAGTTVAAGLNPAHGQPGHRCDIAVGKPLNSEPTKN